MFGSSVRTREATCALRGPRRTGKERSDPTLGTVEINKLPLDELKAEVLLNVAMGVFWKIDLRRRRSPLLSATAHLCLAPGQDHLFSKVVF